MTNEREPRPRVSHAGASGYTGAELLRSWWQHPGSRWCVTAESHAKPAHQPDLSQPRRVVDLICRRWNPEALAAEAEFVFLRCRTRPRWRWEPI